MSEKRSDDVIGKLGKVADSLESATTQLNNVATQQQLDVARERISKCEADVQSIQCQIVTRDEVINNLSDSVSKSSIILKNLEKDLAGIRALTMSSFVISIICLVGMILCITKL